MQAIIKSSWKHVLFALLVFGFISCATTTTAPKKERPAAAARKEGPKHKRSQAELKKRTANSFTENLEEINEAIP